MLDAPVPAAWGAVPTCAENEVKPEAEIEAVLEVARAAGDPTGTPAVLAMPRIAEAAKPAAARRPRPTDPEVVSDGLGASRCAWLADLRFMPRNVGGSPGALDRFRQFRRLRRQPRPAAHPLAPRP